MIIHPVIVYLFLYLGSYGLYKAFDLQFVWSIGTFLSPVISALLFSRDYRDVLRLLSCLATFSIVFVLANGFVFLLGLESVKNGLIFILGLSFFQLFVFIVVQLIRGVRLRGAR